MWTRRWLTLILVALTLWLTAGSVQADGAKPDFLKDVAFDQKLDAQLPLDVVFRDEKWRTLSLREMLDGKPAILTLTYYNCKNLCPLELEGLVGVLSNVDLDMNKDFKIVSLSIDPREGPDLARQVKKEQMRRYLRAPQSGDGWYMLTGDEVSIRWVADTVGYKFSYDPKEDDYVHGTGVIVLTPEGKVSRYFYGLTYNSRDLRLALVEASQNKIGNLVDQVLLTCYRYDPTVGRYSFVAMNAVRWGAALMMVAVAVFWAFNWRINLNHKGPGATPDSTRPV